MLRKALIVTIVVGLMALLTPTNAQAWGAAHFGYTHVGPGGVYHYGRTAAVGPYGAYSGAHVGGYGYGGAYHTAAAVGVNSAVGYHYSAASGYGGYGYGTVPYGGYGYGYAPGVYRP
jgi:hypothetical protein